MRLAILNCSDIAKRRMIPAFKSVPDIEIIIVCSRNLERSEEFAQEFDIPIYTDDPDDITAELVDLVYISSPPELHYSSIREFLLKDIHVLCEKSFTTDYEKTKDLIRLANSKNLIIQENYAFPHHPQWKWIKENLHKIGRIQTIRSAFEFPPRDKKTDFRYDQKLGGGALMDAGGYPIKAAGLLLNSVELAQFGSSTVIDSDIGVDITGACFLTDDRGVSAFLSWSFDSTYKCFIEITGSKGWIKADKIFTPRADEVVKVNLKTQSNEISVDFVSDHFKDLVVDLIERIKKGDNSHHQEILQQSKYQELCKSY